MCIHTTPALSVDDDVTVLEIHDHELRSAVMCNSSIFIPGLYRMNTIKSDELKKIKGEVAVSLLWHLHQYHHCAPMISWWFHLNWICVVTHAAASPFRPLASPVCAVSCALCCTPPDERWPDTLSHVTYQQMGKAELLPEPTGELGPPFKSQRRKGNLHSRTTKVASVKAIQVENYSAQSSSSSSSRVFPASWGPNQNAHPDKTMAGSSS